MRIVDSVVDFAPQLLRQRSDLNLARVLSLLVGSNHVMHTCIKGCALDEFSINTSEIFSRLVVPGSCFWTFNHSIELLPE